MNSIYLVNSGGQYPDGTTDVTRTVAIGEPTAEMRDRFTRVLKGHIAVARAVFPEGTRGGQLDSFARQYLWQAGLDYAHGTGHGVGAYLAVHEGPQRIAPAGSGQAGGDEPLQAGMFLSNEPGYYKTGEYGIRVENLVLVEPREIDGAEKRMLGFETLTFAPIDRNLVEVGAAVARGARLAERLSRARCWRSSGRSSTARRRPGWRRAARRSDVIPAKAAACRGRRSAEASVRTPAFAGMTGRPDLLPARLRLPPPQILAQRLGQPFLPFLVALRHDLP